jgi:endonuclease YncB( thermonuclease family)
VSGRFGASASRALAILAGMLLLLVWLERDGGSGQGRVLHVFDGDSFTMAGAEADAEVRLFGIDSPEPGQGWNRRSRQALKALIGGERVRLEVVETDRYGRLVARVFRERDGLDVNAEQVRDGHGWVYRHYTDNQEWLALEAAARAEGRGLWSLPEADREPPWEWRRKNRRR